METAPKSAINTRRGLTHSLDLHKEGLAMNATRTQKAFPMDAKAFARFNAQYEVAESGCWEWTATVMLRKGYGQFSYGRLMLAHRASYEHFRGAIPEGLNLDHLCRNRKCVNPDHLEAVTQRVNVMRGVSVTAENMRKSHCPTGHPYDAANTYVRANGHRGCRACRKVHKQAFKSRQAAMKEMK